MKIPTPTQAIKAKCLDCIYDPLSGHGSALKQVTDCPSTDCPLYPVRPVDSAEKALRKQLKIDKMTPDELMKYRKKQELARERFSASK